MFAPTASRPRTTAPGRTSPQAASSAPPTTGTPSARCCSPRCSGVRTASGAIAAIASYPSGHDANMCSVVTYTELHLHSAYSFLDGASMPDEIVPKALELGHEAVALTDHNSLSGSMEFAQHAKALGLRALHGAEVDLDDGRHITLLVRDARGWRNLCRLLTRAHAHTRVAGRPGWSGDRSVTPADVAEHAPGLVCLSGCARHGVRDEPTMRY